MSNNVTLVGNLVDDPELRFTPSGVAMAKLRIAVNRRWRDRQSGEWQEDTSFFNVVVWGEHGENVADSLTKGDRVIVTGRLDQRSWETDQGDKRSVVEVIADEVGPSLRWATAEIEKSERKGSGDQGGGDRSDRAPAPTPSGGSEYSADEEPF